MLRNRRKATYLVLITVAAALLMLLGVPLASQEHGSGGNAKAARFLREPLGFGERGVLPASEDDQRHRWMIQTAILFAQREPGLTEQLVVRRENAMHELVRRVTWEDDVDAGYAELERSGRAIVDGGLRLFEDMRRPLKQERRQLAGRVIDNRMLDPDLRALDLSEQQREAVLSSQKARDAVTLDARNWHNTGKLSTARSEFEDALATTLTRDQRAELATYRERLRARLADMARAEADAEDDG